MSSRTASNAEMAFAPNASEADRREESDDAMLIREWPNEPRQALSADTLTKRLDSARREVRGYRTLYFTLFGFGLLSLLGGRYASRNRRALLMSSMTQPTSTRSANEADRHEESDDALQDGVRLSETRRALSADTLTKLLDS